MSETVSNPLFLIGVLNAILLVAILVRMARPKGADASPLGAKLDALSDWNERLERGIATQFKDGREEASRQAGDLRKENSQLHEALRTKLDEKLKELREDNSKKLDEMRKTVDEKLQTTLEKRLGESFKQVGERLEQVHRGLGEMQTLATGVGDLKKVLTNVKTLGGWGEVQLEALLAEILIPDQYTKQVVVQEHSNEKVDFAIKMPGKDDGGGSVLLPVDAKFPKEDYERLVDASEAADAKAIEAAKKQLERTVKQFAKSIQDKYILPPRTTNYAVMFLPTEGLYMEVVRLPGLIEKIQRDFRVVVAGPTTFSAFLNSLQMGFHTLAIQKRSGEIWKVLGAVKTEFGKFGVTLKAVQTKLHQASKQMETVQSRTNKMGEKLEKVEELPQPAADEVLRIPALENVGEGETNDS